MATAHAIFACVAWAVIFPIGGIITNVLSLRGSPRLVWTHAGLQIAGFYSSTIALLLGIMLLTRDSLPVNNLHTIVGITLFALWFIQLALGCMIHVKSESYGVRTLWTPGHLWMGRLWIIVGIINGIFGFQLSGKGTDSWEAISYMTFAFPLLALYAAATLLKDIKKGANSK
jgi:hypothetical protein